MKLYPEYSENIIVYLISGGEGHWYVTDKELWFLDRVSFSRAFGLNADAEDFEFLKDLSFGSGRSLIEEIGEYQTTTEELRELIKIYPSISEDESILEMRPSVYVDLDKRVLKNLFPEPSGVFEKFAPASWVAKFEDFWELIPNRKRYWEVDGKSSFDQVA